MTMFHDILIVFPSCQSEWPRDDHTIQRSASGSTTEANSHTVSTRHLQGTGAAEQGQQGERIREDDDGGSQEGLMILTELQQIILHRWSHWIVLVCDSKRF